MDPRGEKRYQEIIKDTYVQPKAESSKSNLQDDENEDPAAVISTHENSLRDIRKPPDVLQIEEEYNALT